MCVCWSARCQRGVKSRVDNIFHPVSSLVNGKAEGISFFPLPFLKAKLASVFFLFSLAVVVTFFFLSHNFSLLSVSVMDSLYNWSDATKIGVALTGLGVFFSAMGVVLLLDSILLTMGNVFFVAGVAMVMGPARCKTFFIARQRASLCFFVGMLFVLLRWCFIGLCIEGFGALNLFGNFFPMVARVLESMPVIGPIMLSYPVQKLLALLRFNDGRSARNV